MSAATRAGGLAAPASPDPGWLWAAGFHDPAALSRRGAGRVSGTRCARSRRLRPRSGAALAARAHSRTAPRPRAPRIARRRTGRRRCGIQTNPRIVSSCTRSRRAGLQTNPSDAGTRTPPRRAGTPIKRSGAGSTMRLPRPPAIRTNPNLVGTRASRPDGACRTDPRSEVPPPRMG
jgi:hypothetical protein